MHITISAHFNRPNLYRINPAYNPTDIQPNPPALRSLRVPHGTSAGNIDYFTLPWRWVEYFHSQQPTFWDWRYMTLPKTATFNIESDPDWYEHGKEPKYNTVACMWGLVNVLEIKPLIDENGDLKDHAIIETLLVDEPVPTDKKDYLVQQFFMTNSDLVPMLPGGGHTCFIPLITQYPSVIAMDMLTKV